MSELVIENLWKEYDSQIVLERISLTIASRSFVPLLVHQAVASLPFCAFCLDKNKQRAAKF